jgi:hypothetical protein
MNNAPHMQWQSMDLDAPAATPAQERFYCEYLHSLFTALEMPDVAACFATDSSTGEFEASFDDMQPTAGADNTHNPFE